MTKENVNIAISNRHVHLTKEVYDMLFDEPLTIRNSISQKGEFASNQTLTIRTNKNKIENVRVVGPLRKYNQIEISKTDSIFLGINPPIRMSGDLDDACGIMLETKKDKIAISSCIIQERHVHMNKEKADSLNVSDGDIVKLQIYGKRPGVIEIKVKVTDNGVFEAHLDTDEANALDINENNHIGTIIID